MPVIEYKPEGVSSYVHSDDVRLKYGAKKIAYTGRLDLMAQGKVKYLLDEECKQWTKYSKSIKTYEFYLVLGLKTDSLDCLGLITDVDDKISLEDDEIESTIKSFICEYEQEFPVFSTKTIEYEGKKEMLIKLFRDKGYIPDELPKKSVKIYNIEFLTEIFDNEILKEFYNSVDQFHDPYNIWRRMEVLHDIKEHDMEKLFKIVKLRAKVSSGTYVRQLCCDIGKKLGVNACAYQIKRTNIEEPFDE